MFFKKSLIITDERLRVRLCGNVRLFVSVAFNLFALSKILLSHGGFKEREEKRENHCDVIRSNLKYISGYHFSHLEEKRWYKMTFNTNFLIATVICMPK